MLIVVGVSVISVYMRFKELAIILGTPMHVHVDLFLAAVWKLQNSSEHLTTLHPHFLHICLLVNCSKTGLSNLEEDISEVDHLDGLFLYLLLWVSCFCKDFSVFVVLFFRELFLLSCPFLSSLQRSCSHLSFYFLYGCLVASFLYVCCIRLDKAFAAHIYAI